MKNLGYYNGEIGLIEDIKIPMLDRACVFGDGIYDATYSRNHIIYNLKEHVDRFFSSAAKLGMEVPMTKDELSELLSDLVERVDDGEQFVYFHQTAAFTGPGPGFCRIALVFFRDHHTDPGSQYFDRLRKGKVIPIHEETENIAAFAAAETMVTLTGGIDMKGGSFLLMKRAESFV